MKVETYIREPTEQDQNFIYNSWLKSLRQSLSLVDKSIYFIEQKKIIATAVRDSTVLVSCNPDYLDQIFGYIVYDDSPLAYTTIHYVYVKHPYRRYGIGSELVSLVEPTSVPFVASHWTRCFEFISESWNLVFNPYILLRSTNEAY